jgi:hypothetical protein
MGRPNLLVQVNFVRPFPSAWTVEDKRPAIRVAGPVRVPVEIGVRPESRIFQGKTLQGGVDIAFELGPSFGREFVLGSFSPN